MLVPLTTERKICPPFRCAVRLLGSGSEGNALVVEAGPNAHPDGLRFFFFLSWLRRWLAWHVSDWGRSSWHAIVVTHPMSMATSIGRSSLAWRRQYSHFPVFFFLTHGTPAFAKWFLFCKLCAASNRKLISAPCVFSLLLVNCWFSISRFPMIASEPVQYVFVAMASGDLGVLTDAGCSTPHIRVNL